jgi:alpha(1,3/1,4) fucosyltransferase
MPLPLLRLNFSDFWEGFDKSRNAIYDLLSRQYRLELSDDPGVLIYSNYGIDFLKYKCTRVFVTHENLQPNFNECDYSFAFDYIDSPRHYRLPCYWFYGDMQKLVKTKSPDTIRQAKTGFCAFVVSNPYCPERNEFFQRLSRYKRVDSGGRHLNNIGYNVPNKLDFIRRYKFVISFENSSFPGYTTEKIVEPMQVDSIPVYWGNPGIGEEFNAGSFINCHNYRDFDEVIKEIERIDSDDAVYEQYLRQPWFPGNRVPESLTGDAILEQFDRIIDNTRNGAPSVSSEKQFTYLRKFKELLIAPVRLLIPLKLRKKYWRLFFWYANLLRKSKPGGPGAD